MVGEFLTEEEAKEEAAQVRKGFTFKLFCFC
jgi:hypothetical protein